MKRLLRAILFESVSLYLTSQLISGLIFHHEVLSFIIVGGFLSISSFIVKPVVNILLLPLNLVTLNFFRWVGNFVCLYLATLLVSKEFYVSAFSFPGYHSIYLDIPAVAFPAGVLSLIAFSVVLSIISGILHWLVKSH
jgi:uncharacterized membrane protein YvlD (DUF360 family)